MGQITYTLYFWLQYTGVQQTNASIASILVVGLIPVATAFVAQFFGDERLSLARLAALLIGFAGVAVIVLQQPLLLCAPARILLRRALPDRQRLCLRPLLLAEQALDAHALAAGDDWWHDARRSRRPRRPLAVRQAHNRWGDVLRLDGVQVAALLFLVLVCSVAAYFAYNSALRQSASGQGGDLHLLRAGRRGRCWA